MKYPIPLSSLSTELRGKNTRLYRIKITNFILARNFILLSIANNSLNKLTLVTNAKPKNDCSTRIRIFTVNLDASHGGASEF